MKSHPSDCSCVADIAKTAMQLQRAHPERVIYQTSLMSALLSGVYEGETTMADLLQHGDFGLGTFNHLDGEMIAFNRKFSSCVVTAAPAALNLNRKRLLR